MVMCDGDDDGRLYVVFGVQVYHFNYDIAKHLRTHTRDNILN